MLQFNRAVGFYVKVRGNKAKDIFSIITYMMFLRQPILGESGDQEVGPKDRMCHLINLATPGVMKRCNYNEDCNRQNRQTKVSHLIMASTTPVYTSTSLLNLTSKELCQKKHLTHRDVIYVKSCNNLVHRPYLVTSRFCSNAHVLLT